MSRGSAPTTYRSPSTGGRAVRVRLSAREYAALARAATRDGVSIAGLMREAALARATATTTGATPDEE